MGCGSLDRQERERFLIWSSHRKANTTGLKISDPQSASSIAPPPYWDVSLYVRTSASCP